MPPRGWRHTERFLERAGECGLRFIADNFSNLCKGRVGVAELLGRDLHAPTGEVVHWRGADQTNETVRGFRSWTTSRDLLRGAIRHAFHVTPANVFGLVERFINAKVLELSHEHWFGDQVALEALVRFSDEELKHQALFRRIDAMVGEVLPDGYRFDIDPNAVARAVLGKSTWAVLALTLDIELFTQLHYRQSIEHDTELSELFKDIFLYHWKEESQHAILDELEWARHDAGLTAEQRDRAVDEFIELVAAVDGVLQAQAKADAGYFVATCGRTVQQAEEHAIEDAFLKAYRWQYIHFGAQHPHFGKVLSSLITENQGQRIQAALATLH